MSEARIGYTNAMPEPVWFDPLGAAREKSFRGMLWGTAVGDAWGYPTEFLKRDKIVRWYGADGPELPVSPRISDDTQMTLALAQALSEADDAEQAEDLIIRHFLDWLHDPDNDRAPGRACTSSLRRLEKDPRCRWPEATSQDSKGAGANMRVGPAAFIKDDRQRFTVARTQAAITHGHPTAVIASEMTAATIWLIAHGDHRLDGLLDSATRAAQFEYRTHGYPDIYKHDGIRQIAERRDQQFGYDRVEDGMIVYDNWAGEYQGQGRREIADALTRAAEGLEGYSDGDDPCKHVGQGWTAEEALAVALFCIEVSERDHPGDPYAALRLAASTNGDSDTIGAIAGAVLGAAYGPDPYRQIGTNIEPRYREWLESVAMPGF